LWQLISSGQAKGVLLNPIILILSTICFPDSKAPEHPSCMGDSFYLMVEKISGDYQKNKGLNLICINKRKK